MLINYKTLDYLKTGIGEENLQEIIDLYLSTSPEILLNLKKAVECKDGKEMFFWSHRLKGSSSTLGFEDIQNLSEQLETLSKQGNIESAIEKYHAIVITYEALKTELNGMAS